MWEFITHSGNAPFTAALLIMLVIAVMEGVTTLLGMGLSSLFDSLLPEFDIAGPDGELSSGGASAILGWLHIGKVPILVLLVVFLTGFGLVGWGLQSVSQQMFGFLTPNWMAAIPAFLLALPVVRVGGSVIHHIMPDDETEAVSKDSFIGAVATITLGVARQDHPAEAKLQDQFGQTHYVMVEPDLAGVEFQQGDKVLVVKRAGARFRVIASQHQSLQ